MPRHRLAICLALFTGALSTSEIEAQLAFDVQLCSAGGALFAHTNAIDLKQTRTYRMSRGDIDMRRVVAEPGGVVVNRGKAPIRFLLFLRPGEVGQRLHHHGQTMELRGEGDDLRVYVGPEGFDFRVGGPETPIWKTVVLQPGQRASLARIPTEQ